jgi:peptide deformylase
MILPIYAYGMPVLRKKAEEITPQYEGLDTLLKNMFETMYDSSGIGLAAPQIGLPIRLFIVDGTDIEDDPSTKDFKQVFINAQILEEFDTPWEYEEGCLSIPFVRANVKRNAKVPFNTWMKIFRRKPKPTRAWPHESSNMNTTTSRESYSPTESTRSSATC